MRVVEPELIRGAKRENGCQAEVTAAGECARSGEEIRKPARPVPGLVL